MKYQTIAFLLAFILLFALLSGLGFLTANIDWTWGRILICLVIVGGTTIAWSLIKGKSFAQSLGEVGFGVPHLSNGTRSILCFGHHIRFHSDGDRFIRGC